MKAATGSLGEGGGRSMQQFDSSAVTNCITRPPRKKFIGTTNPRHLRVLTALFRNSLPRETVDAIAGCSNGPELIAELRRRGLQTPCTLIPVVDRDGRLVERGVYHFTASDRRKVRQWIATRKRNHGK